jgi:hypothetical protein
MKVIARVIKGPATAVYESSDAHLYRGADQAVEGRDRRNREMAEKSDGLMWSRRSFLKLAATAAGVAIVGLDASLLQIQEPVFLTGLAVEYHDLSVFSFGYRKYDGDLLVLPGNTGGLTRWSAVPGDEIAVGDGFINTSKGDVRILFLTLRRGTHHYSWSPTNGMQGFELGAPRLGYIPLIENAA